MLEIVINRTYIYEYVTLLTGQIGRSRGSYDQFVCSPDSYPSLDRFMDAAINEVETTLVHHLADSYATTLQYNDQDITLQIDDKSGYLAQQVRGALHTNLRLAIAFMLSSMWVQVLDPDTAAKWADSSTSYLLDAIHLLIQHDTISATAFDQQGEDSVSLDGHSSLEFQDNKQQDDQDLSGRTGQLDSLSARFDDVVEKPGYPGHRDIRDTILRDMRGFRI